MNLYIPIESFRNEQNVQSIKGKAIGLPDDFLALKEGSKGGGVIQVRCHFIITNHHHSNLSIGSHFDQTLMNSLRKIQLKISKNARPSTTDISIGMYFGYNVGSSCTGNKTS